MSQPIIAFSGSGLAPVKTFSPAGVNLGDLSLQLGTGNCFGFHHIDSGELGASSLNSGTVFGVYSAAYAVLGEFNTFPIVTQSIASDYATEFYASTYPTTGDSVLVFDQTGQIASLSLGASAAAVAIAARDRSIVYYAGTNPGSDLRTIYKRDVVGASTSTFVSKSSPYRLYQFNGLLCLRDGRVVIAWYNDDTGVGLLELYDAAGSLVRSYTLPGTDSNRFPLSVTPGTDDSSFWALIYDQDVPTYNGVIVAEFSTSADTILHQFNPDDGSFGFDGPFCVIPPLECCEPPDTSPDPILAFNPERVDTRTYNRALEEVADNEPEA